MMDKEHAEGEGRMIDASGSSDATITVFLVSQNCVHFVKILDNDMNRHQSSSTFTEHHQSDCFSS